MCGTQVSAICSDETVSMQINILRELSLWNVEKITQVHIHVFHIAWSILYNSVFIGTKFNINYIENLGRSLSSKDLPSNSHK